MAKKSSGKGGASNKPKGKGGMTAEDHRKMAGEHHAKARLHSARADLMDAKDPKKSKGVCPY